MTSAVQRRPFNSLSRDHLALLRPRRTPPYRLSTPSLGITRITVDFPTPGGPKMLSTPSLGITDE